ASPAEAWPARQAGPGRRRPSRASPAPPQRRQRRLTVGRESLMRDEVLLGTPRHVAATSPVALQLVLERGQRGVEGDARRVAEAVGVDGRTARHLDRDRTADAGAALG